MFKKIYIINETDRLIFECARWLRGYWLHSRYYTSCHKRGFPAHERRPAGHGSWAHLQDWCERRYSIIM